MVFPVHPSASFPRESTISLSHQNTNFSGVSPVEIKRKGRCANGVFEDDLVIPYGLRYATT